jgi:hypothetical protein
MTDLIQMLETGLVEVCGNEVTVRFSQPFDAHSFFELLADGITMDKFERERRAHQATIAIRRYGGDAEYWRIRGIVSQALLGQEHDPATKPVSQQPSPPPVEADPAFIAGRRLLIEGGKKAIDMIASGNFYEDYDASTEALGDLRSLLAVVEDTLR